MHVLCKLRRDVEVEPATVWAHGDNGRTGEATLIELAPDGGWQSWTVIAYPDADFALPVGNSELVNAVLI